MAKPCAAHAGFAKSKQRNVLFVSRQIVAIGPHRVDECVDTFGKEDPFKIVLNKGLGFGIVRQQLFDLSLGQFCRTVFDNCSGCVVTVAKTVIGKNSQTFGFVHVSNNGRAGKGIQNRGNSIRGITPYPVDQFLFAADVIGDVLGAFLWGLLFRSLPFSQRLLMLVAHSLPFLFSCSAIPQAIAFAISGGTAFPTCMN